MKKILLSVFMLSIFVFAMGIASAYTPASTNDQNRINGWAHVDEVSVSPGEVTLDLIQPRSFYSCFEYRTDGDISQVINEEHFLETYNVVDESEGLQQYPYFCLSTISTQTETFSANEYVEIRMIQGAEGDERFDWTRFDVGAEEDAPEIEIENSPEYPMCSDDVEVCATVTDFSGVSKVDMTCTTGNIAVTKNDVVAEGDSYCAKFSSSTFDTPADGDVLTCTVKAWDTLGNKGILGPTDVATYDCANPLAVITGDFTCNEGETVTLSGEDSTDTVTPTNELIYSWTGVTTSNGDSAEVQCIDDGIIDVTLTVEDHVGLTDTDEETVTVSNVDPVAYITGDSSAYEGSSVALTGSATDDGVLDTHSFKWTVDSIETTGTSLTVSCVDEELISVTLEVTDDDGGVGTATHDVECMNANPVVEAGDDQIVNEGEEVTIAPTFTDAGVLDTHTVEVNWGSGFTESLSHSYCSEGDHTVTVRVTDNDGGVGEDTLTVTVNNVMPYITSVGGPYIGAVYDRIDFLATAEDVCDTVTISWDFSPEGTHTDDWQAYWISRFNGEVVLTIDDGTDTVSQNVPVTIYDYGISLDQGWNLISIPLVPENDDTSIVNVFQSVIEEVEVVWAYTYDPVQEKNVWTYNEVTEGSFDSEASLLKIVPGYGYYVKMSEDSILYMNGEKGYQVGGEDNMPVLGMPPSVTLLMDSWNLIGTFGLENIYHGTALDSLEDQNKKKYYDIIYDEDGESPWNLYPMEGYWLSLKKIFSGTETIQYKAYYEDQTSS